MDSVIIARALMAHVIIARVKKRENVVISTILRIHAHTEPITESERVTEGDVGAEVRVTEGDVGTETRVTEGT